MLGKLKVDMTGVRFDTVKQIWVLVPAGGNRATSCKLRNLAITQPRVLARPGCSIHSHYEQLTVVVARPNNVCKDQSSLTAGLGKH